MVVEFPNYITVDYEDGRGQSAKEYHSLEDKLEKSIQVVTNGLDQYESPAIMWTGGKDSTLLLYVIREVARERGKEIPPVIFIDHFAHFSEIIEFVGRWANIWDFAPCKIIVQEAKGKFSNFTGNKARIDAGNAISGNPRLVKAIRRMIREGSGQKKRT